MFVSRQQTYILEVLQKMGCIRRTQLLALVRAAFWRPDLEITEPRLDVMLRQLRHITDDVRMDEQMVYLEGCAEQPRYLEALDVMLELTEGRPREFEVLRGKEPLLLYFLHGRGRGRGIWVADLAEGYVITPQNSDSELGERTVWISASGEPPETLLLPLGHFFAARKQDGMHRFYGATET